MRHCRAVARLHGQCGNPPGLAGAGGVHFRASFVELSPRRVRRAGGKHELAGSWHDRASLTPLFGAR
jgi:hypothetical protein